MQEDAPSAQAGPPPGRHDKNAAVAVGRLGRVKGNKAQVAMPTAEEHSEIAKRVAEKR